MERRLFIKKVMGWCGAILALLFGCKAHINGRHQLSYRKAFKPVNPDLGVAVLHVPDGYTTFCRGNFGTFCEPDAGWETIDAMNDEWYDTNT